VTHIHEHIYTHRHSDMHIHTHIRTPPNAHIPAILNMLNLGDNLVCFSLVTLLVLVLFPFFGFRFSVCLEFPHFCNSFKTLSRGSDDF
jgi:hypothetical protein